jgi:hypothetical protein
MRTDIEINCKGISDITPRGYDMDVSIEECDLSFIVDISSKDIVMNCNDPSELLEEIDEEVIHEYLRSRGYVYNKA